MYFLEKLCRICVQTNATLVSIDTVDYDLVRLSEKLRICANLVITEDCLSSGICGKCVNKLRLSYHFLGMCKKSTTIIQGYLTKLTNSDEELSHESASVEGADLSIDIERLPNYKLQDSDEILEQAVVGNKTVSRRKPRITKEQRCSLLKQLLDKPKQERDKTFYCHDSYDYTEGGLKSIIDFTKNYEFNFNIDSCTAENTPLNQLTAFSENYFTRDFTDFKNHILYVIENRHEFQYYSDGEDGYLSQSDAEDESNVEEVLVEPDIKIKEEMPDCDEESQCPLDYLETSFQEQFGIKKEEPQSDSENERGDTLFNTDMEKSNFLYQTQNNFPTIPEAQDSNQNFSPAVKLLDRLVSTYPMSSKKFFSASSVRCRTRDQPYINPLLKDQFLYRSFRCENCNRYFKSQGYLKAHKSKVH